MQKLITAGTASQFESYVNAAFKEGYTVVPGTLVVAPHARVRREVVSGPPTFSSPWGYFMPAPQGLPDVELAYCVVVEIDEKVQAERTRQYWLKRREEYQARPVPLTFFTPGAEQRVLAKAGIKTIGDLLVKEPRALAKLFRSREAVKRLGKLLSHCMLENDKLSGEPSEV